MPIGFGLALRIKGKLKSLFDDLDDKPSHPQRERESQDFLGEMWGRTILLWHFHLDPI